jgi:hypothetical protein
MESKTPLIVGLGVAAVLILIYGVVALVNGH